MERPVRFIAVDWSGDKSIAGQRRKIWVADWKQGTLALKSGMTRAEAAAYLIAAARETPRMVAGLDFAFSFPAWFVRQQGCAGAEEFWQLVAEAKGEEWLAQPNSFCWGRKGRRCPNDHREPEWRGFRQTDRDFNVAGTRPKSPFQICGAGAVGTGSLRGIPVLRQLREAGFSIWPFHRIRLPVAIEIYPRLFTGPGNKSSEGFRARRLAEAQYKRIDDVLLGQGRQSEDAFDALCSAFAMREHADDLARLEQASAADILIEGAIWRPAGYRSPGMNDRPATRL